MPTYSALTFWILGGIDVSVCERLRGMRVEQPNHDQRHGFLQAPEAYSSPRPSAARPGPLDRAVSWVPPRAAAEYSRGMRQLPEPTHVPTVHSPASTSGRTP